jgi:predicted transcriptional regulator
MTSKPFHTMTIRVPLRLRKAVQRVAERRGLSVNSLVRESLDQLIEAETRAQWAAGFEALGRDTELSNVGPYFAAQAETLPDE